MAYTSKVVGKHPAKARWKYTDEELILSASQFKHRADWKKGANRHYQAAFFRGILDKCCAHMTRASNPYAGDYIIYAYEFEDRHAYVGLTFLHGSRRLFHAVRGPVADHAKVCPTYTYRELEKDIQTPDEAASAETMWQAKYIADGWTPLWKNRAGGLGTVTRQKWTKEAVLAEARKYKSKQDWINGSQMSYRIAKREGWFEEASAHMPKRVLGIGAGVAKTPEAREKMRQAKLGKSLSAGHRAKIAASVSTSWKNKSAKDVVETLLD